jgi:hypothetical protein
MGIRAQAFVARSRDPILSRLTKRPAEGRDWHAPCGRINGAFLKHSLIDEFSTLIFPEAFATPSTVNLDPVMYGAFALARNATALAIKLARRLNMPRNARS